MSKSDIMNELAKLSKEDRQEVRSQLAEWDQDDWLDARDLTEAQRALIEERCREMDAHPRSSLPWEEARVQLLNAIKR